MDRSQAVLVAINAIVCLGGGFLCIERLAKMNSRVKLAIQIQYATLLAMFASSFLSFAYGYPATPIQLFMGIVTACHLMIGLKPWKHGPPDYSIKGRA